MAFKVFTLKFLIVSMIIQKFAESKGILHSTRQELDIDSHPCKAENLKVRNFEIPLGGSMGL